MNTSNRSMPSTRTSTSVRATGNAMPDLSPARDGMQTRINLGCGPVQPASWTNVDGSNRAWLASRLPWFDRFLVVVRLLPPTEFHAGTVFADLTRKFPWRDASVEAVYMGEVLEHFTREQGRHVLKECHRVLQRGGVLRVRVPDNARFWANYLAEFKAARELPKEQWTLAHTRWIEMFFREICVRPPGLRSMGHFHKWMYDEVSLVCTLRDLGFAEVERKPYLESRIRDIGMVEVRDDLIVEAVKP